MCMTTFNRIDYARINQEIIKLNYRRSLPIVHACSSTSYERHLEDILTVVKPKALHQGALELLKESFRTAMRHFAPEYLIHLEGDTWIMEEEVIHKLLRKMDADKQTMICTSRWDEDLLAFKYLKSPTAKLWMHHQCAKVIRKFGINYRLECADSLATQFFILRAVPEALDTVMSLEYIPGLDLEQAFYRKFMEHFRARNVLRLRQREPIHPFNRYVSERLALYSQHWPARGTANDERDPTHPRYIPPTMDGKYETLLRFPRVRQGAFIQKLINAESYDYYNPGASRT